MFYLMQLPKLAFIASALWFVLFPLGLFKVCYYYFDVKRAARCTVFGR